MIPHRSAVVSVVMADYNTPPDRLRAAIRSILVQTFTDFEFLIVDDGTSTDLAAVLDEFGDERIRVLGDGIHRGFAAALNRAIAESRAEFIVRIDTDDWVDPSYIDELYDFMRAHPEFDVVSAQAEEFSASGTTRVLVTPGEKRAKDVMRGSTPIHAASILRRAALMRVGGYPDHRRAEDLALWCELLLARSRLYVIPRVLYHHRVDPADFEKRKLRYRGGELRVRLHYYPLLGAGPREYLRIAQSVAGGVLPRAVVRRLHSLRYPGST